MNHVAASSMNELQIALCQHLMRFGESVEPRGMQTREVLGFSLELSNPRNRLTTLHCRKWSAALAVAELAWHLRGDTDVGPLEFYTPRWREFADADGSVRGNCYGARIFKAADGSASQWQNVKRLLAQDLSSRRAILNFRVDEDVSRHTNDVSCTNTIQFIVRENKLHAFVGMRSNDAIWGVPYDVFLFTCLQELMALELGVELGRYHHYSASMHVYERHFSLAETIGGLVDPGVTEEMPAMTSPDAVQALAVEEEILRTKGHRSGGFLGGFEAACVGLLQRHKVFSEAA